MSISYTWTEMAHPRWGPICWLYLNATHWLNRIPPPAHIQRSRYGPILDIGYISATTNQEKEKKRYTKRKVFWWYTPDTAWSIKIDSWLLPSHELAGCVMESYPNAAAVDVLNSLPTERPTAWAIREALFERLNRSLFASFSNRLRTV